jgi:hypothetical protein
MTASRLDNEAIFHAARDIPDPDHRRHPPRPRPGRLEQGRHFLPEGLPLVALGLGQLF